MQNNELEKIKKGIDYEKRKECFQKKICYHCGNKLKNPTPTKGQFKGQIQKYSWYCDCKDWPKGFIMCCG